MRHKRQNIIIILLIFSVFFNSSAYITQAESNINVTLNDYLYHEFENPPIYDDGRVLLPVRDFANLFKFKIDWNAITREVTLIGVEQKISLTVGKRIATVNGNQIKLDVAPKIKNGYTYVPLRFVSETFGAQVNWNQKTNTVNIDYEQRYIMRPQGNTTYWMHLTDGTLYYAKGNNYAEELVKLNMDIKDWGGLSIEEIDDTSIFVTVTDCYGEPHVNDVIYKAFIKNGEILHETKEKYFIRKIGANIEKYNGNYVMNDGKRVDIVNRSGEIINTYDLVELSGEDEIYFIEAIADEYILIRPFNTGLLTFIDLKNNNKVLLYKSLLSQQDIEYVEYMIVDGFGDNLTFKEQKGDVLYFQHRSIFNNEEVIYQYEWK